MASIAPENNRKSRSIEVILIWRCIYSEPMNYSLVIIIFVCVECAQPVQANEQMWRAAYGITPVSVVRLSALNNKCSRCSERATLKLTHKYCVFMPTICVCISDTTFWWSEMNKWKKSGKLWNHHEMLEFSKSVKIIYLLAAFERKQSDNLFLKALAFDHSITCASKIHLNPKRINQTTILYSITKSCPIDF